MKNKTQGFTLIELLIVIAIIGILAAVLIPQLLGARTAANKKAIQSVSANVYKVANAIYAEDQTLDIAAVATAVQTACVDPAGVDQSVGITVPATPTAKNFKYGFTKPPSSVVPGATGCVVTVPAGTQDFRVVILGNAQANGENSVNGATTTP